MQLSYIIKKIYNRFYINFHQPHKEYKNFYFLGTKNKKIKSVLFYFFDTRFMHLGDHLFFEPLCRLFKENGIEVGVIPINVMEPYFKECGYKLEKKEKIARYDLVISKPDFVWDVKKYRNVLLIETAFANIKQPLIDDLLFKCATYFNLRTKVSSKPLYKVRRTNFYNVFLDPNYNYVVFNNYLLSGSFRMRENKYKKLEEFLKKFLLVNPGFKVIHTGSEKDKDNDNNTYSYVDQDLRGKTTVMDLFDLCSLPNVKFYVGFDGFLMHLFFLLERKAYVMSRGRWSKKERFFLENYIDPPYHVDDVEKIKEYIR